MKKLISIFVLAVFLLALVFWIKSDNTDPKNPVTLTIWHSFVEDMRLAFDELINEFNGTVGAENGITVKVTSVTDTRIVSEQLVAAANNDPGAPQLPDLAVMYPRTAVTLAGKGLLVDLEQYISKDYLDTFVPQFLEEGRLGTGKLYLMPIAKSTEVLYVNRTFFDRFSKETGISVEALSTFESIAEAAVKYYEWTDAMTPDISNDGKMFFYPERLFNHAMTAFQQLGSNIVKDKKLNLSDPVFKRVWDCYYAPAVKGGVAIYNGYGNYLASIGDIVCTTSSSAGSTFYPSRITYSDNTREDVVFDVLPFPVFEGGEKVTYQQGGGLCVTKSEQAKERAAALFLKWFTSPERNLRFCAGIGYMPVCQSAFDNILAGKSPVISNPVVAKALMTVAGMRKNYRFFFPPVFDGFESMQTQYAERLLQTARDGRADYLQLLQMHDAAIAFEIVSKEAMDNYIKRFNP